MADWVPYTSGHMIADCGPFTGEWPPYPPLNLPAGCAEVDLMVCLPPPSGNIMDVLNESYPTLAHWSWRTTVGESHAYQFYYAGGEAPQPSDSNTARPGMHAYLIWYDPSSPTVTPLSILPTGMAAGATGPARGSVSGGHWSAWQTGIQQTYQVTDGRLTGRFAGRVITDTNLSGAELVDAKASLDQGQIDAAAGSLQNYLIPDRSEIVIEASKVSPDAANGKYGNYNDEVRLTQNIATFVGTGHESERSYDPSVFTSLSLGFDYYPPDLKIDYEAATSTVAGWADWTIPVEFGFWRAYKLWRLNRIDTPGAVDHFVPLPNYTDPTFRFQAFDADLATATPGDVTGLTWQPYGAGTAVGSFAPVFDHTRSDEQVFGGVPATLTLSAMGPVPILSIVLYTDFQGPLAQPIVDFTVATDTATATDVEGNTNLASSSIRCTLAFGGVTSPYGYVGGVSVPVVPSVVYQNPRWRYWVPGPPPGTGRLHTVGGHFRSAGGAQINMMQQSGIGPWLPIEDL